MRPDPDGERFIRSWDPVGLDTQEACLLRATGTPHRQDFTSRLRVWEGRRSPVDVTEEGLNKLSAITVMNDAVTEPGSLVNALLNMGLGGWGGGHTTTTLRSSSGGGGERQAR